MPLDGMMDNLPEESFSNKLTPKQTELLDWLQEECAEVIKAVAKIKRHGLGNNATQYNNILDLETEIGHVGAVVCILEYNSITHGVVIATANQDKQKDFIEGKCYMHHQ